MNQWNKQRAKFANAIMDAFQRAGHSLRYRYDASSFCLIDVEGGQSRVELSNWYEAFFGAPPHRRPVLLRHWAQACTSTPAQFPKMNHQEIDSTGRKMVERVKASDYPELLKPAIVQAEVQYAVNGDRQPLLVAVDYDRKAVVIPERVNGHEVVDFLQYVLKKEHARTAHYVYVSADDHLIALLMTDEHVLHKASAKIQNGSLLPWKFESEKGVRR